MHGRCDNNHNTSIVLPYTAVFALLYPQHAFRHAANWLGSSNVVWFRLSFAKCFFRFMSTSAIRKEERKTRVLTSRVISDWWIEEILLFAQIFVLLLENLRKLVLMNAVFVLWMTPQFWMTPKLVAIFKIEKHALSGSTAHDSILHFWSEKKNPYLI